MDGSWRVGEQKVEEMMIRRKRKRREIVNRHDKERKWRVRQRTKKNRKKKKRGTSLTTLILNMTGNFLSSNLHHGLLFINPNITILKYTLLQSNINTTQQLRGKRI